jgi:hypothetical protein
MLNMSKQFVKKAFHLSILTIVATFTALSVHPAEAKTPVLSVRKAVAAQNVARTIIVDEDTPLPPDDGDTVFVDGDYLAGAQADVVEHIAQMAMSGKPVVVIGPGFQRLGSEVGVGYTVAREETANGWVEIPAAANIMVVYPQKRVDGRPVAALIQIAGGDRVERRSLVGKVMQTLHEHQLSHQRIQSGDGVDAGSTMAATTGDWPMVAERYWYSYDKWKDKGQLNLHKYYYQLPNDGSDTWDWRNVELDAQVVPGKVEWGSTWHTDWVDTMLKTNEWQMGAYDWPRLLEYRPNTTPSDPTYSVTLGTTAGTNGAAVTASQTWSYPIQDITVEDSSSWSDERFQVRHHYATDCNLSNWTSLLKPGLNIRYPQPYGSLILEDHWRCQWWRPNTWSHYSTTNWVAIYEYGV